MENKPQLCRDTDVAEKLAMSTGWVRNQRWRRRHGHDHTLDIDPVMIGGTPRYRIKDVLDFIQKLEIANEK